MQLLKSGSIVIVLFVTFCVQGRSQQVVNNVTIEKKSRTLYRIQYNLNATPDFDIEKAVLKIYRRRNENVEEIFSAPVSILASKAQNHRLYSFDWTASDKIIQKGDDLQAKIVLSLKTSAARLRLNRIPVADAGNFMQLELPITRAVPLNGSKSHDDDGKIVAIEWKQVGGPTVLNILHQDSLIAFADGDFKAGTYAFEITVKDNLGAVSKSSTSLTVKGPSYWSTSPAMKEASQKSNKTHGSAPQKTQTKLKGGPSNASLNLLLPGVGHYFVSGDYNGQNRKAASFLFTALYAGSLGGAFYLNQKSNDDYKKYDQLAAFREYQKDANGNIIGLRGTSQTEANQYFDKAQSLHKSALICLGAGCAILVGDLIYTFLKGNKNKKEWKSANTSFKPNLFFSSGGFEKTAGVQFKF